MIVPTASEHLQYEIELMEARQENCWRLVRAMVCSPEVNELADEARTAIADAPPYLACLVDAMQRAGMPFRIRALDRRTRFSRTKMREHFHDFCSGVFRTLSAVFVEVPTLKISDESNDQEPDAGRELGNLSWSVLGAENLEADSEVWLVDELTRQVALRDCGPMLRLIAIEAVTKKAVYILTGILMELAGQAPKPTSEDPDGTRYERTVEYIRTANARDERKRDEQRVAIEGGAPSSNNS